MRLNNKQKANAVCLLFFIARYQNSDDYCGLRINPINSHPTIIADTNNTPWVKPPPANTKPGPGQIPASPHPKPNKILPKTRGLSITVLVGMAKGQANKLC